VMRKIAGAEFVDNLAERWWNIALSAAGFLMAILIVCIVGALLASVVGRTLWRMVEKFIMNTPFLRRVYPYIKQITDFVLTQEEKRKMFSRVVAVEYPRKGIWSMGFVTGSGLERVVDNVKKEFLTVLIPTSPTPFTGFVIMVPKKQTIEDNRVGYDGRRSIEICSERRGHNTGRRTGGGGCSAGGRFGK